jgi:hypothetical protein
LATLLSQSPLAMPQARVKRVIGCPQRANFILLLLDGVDYDDRDLFVLDAFDFTPWW